jgi:hypothetical protein
MSDTQEPTGGLDHLEGADPDELDALAAEGIGEGDFDDDPCYTPAYEAPDEDPT